MAAGAPGASDVYQVVTVIFLAVAVAAVGLSVAVAAKPPRLLAGVLTGIGAGLLLDFVLLAGAASGTPSFDVTLTRLGIARPIVYGTVLIVALPLVSRASRMAPAEAIRLTG